MSQGSEDWGLVKLGWNANIAEVGQKYAGFDTLYTVPVGKLFYLSSWWVYCRNNDVDSQHGVLGIYDSGDNIKHTLSELYLNEGKTYSINQAYTIAFKILAEYTIKIYSSNANYVIQAGITGFER